MKFIKENKTKTIISSVIILLPMLVGFIIKDKLPDRLATHWDISGNADGSMSKTTAIITIPLIMLALHLLCLIVTSKDKSNKDQSGKAMNMIFWLVPIISVSVNLFIYLYAINEKINATVFIALLLGIMFIFIGNYMPKVKQNRTIGVKIKWTLSNEENWNKTHRFSGKLWVCNGFINLFLIILPEKAAVIVLILNLIAAVIPPFIYSYILHKKQTAADK